MEMKIFELLSGQPSTSAPSLGAPMPAPMASAPSAAPPPMQTAGLLDTAKNFFSTPQPIGGSAPASPIGPNTSAGNSIANAVPGVSTINNALSGNSGQSQPSQPPIK